MKIIANTKVGNQGWTAVSFDVAIKGEGICAEDLKVECSTWQFHHAEKSIVSEVKPFEGGISIFVEPFNFNKDFRVFGTGKASVISFTQKDITEVHTEWVDQFESKKDKGVLYRLYSPKAEGVRPLVLFLHGGGECGLDNKNQMTGTLGAARIAQDYPDVYVMAPQAPSGLIIQKDGKPNMPRTFAESASTSGTGWTRSYLANICDLIRKMISEGKVDAGRVYVTGLSMGGGGTLRALSVGSGLFAAAAPICPTMTPETYGILCSLTTTKLWISTAYVDHTIYRHKYIVDGILKLRDSGNHDAKLTLYSPEELEKYDIAVDPDMPLLQKFSENHGSWVLTYNNEYGIMDWLMSQTKM